MNIPMAAKGFEFSGELVLDLDIDTIWEVLFADKAL